MIDWHRLFGLILTDFFAGSCFEVELEKDLSQKKQLLDVVILRRTEGTFSGRLPDGMEDLADHNLLTYKSHHEALSDWSLKELTGHYVNYRKQVSPGFDRLLPEDRFRLYAVCARFPEKTSKQLTLTRRQPGAYDIERGTDVIRLIVLSEVPEAEHNAPLHLFSAVPDVIRYGAEHFAKHSAETSTLINDLFNHYQIEGIDMPYTMEDYRQEIVREGLKELTPEERLQGLTSEEIIQSLPADVLREIRMKLEKENGETSNATQQ